MKVSQHADMVVSCLLFILCLSGPPSAVALRTLVVLSKQLLQTSKFFERKK
jgi:hypothetical protein